MFIQALHSVAVIAIAAVAAVIGLWHVAPAEASPWLYYYVIVASAFIWLVFGNLYLRLDHSWAFAILLGLLSPLIGCLLVFPPWSFFFVFAKPEFSILLGLITSIAICITSRSLARIA